MDGEMVGLADAIRSLQAELSRVMQEVGGPGSRLRVKPVEAEFELAVTQAADKRIKVLGDH
jgi:hypothetical protein